MEPVAELPGASLVEQLRDALSESGGVRAPLETLPVSVELWRSSARAAGRSLGRRIRTFEGDVAVEAYLADWPRDDEERRLHFAAMREAVNRIDALPSGPDRDI